MSNRRVVVANVIDFEFEVSEVETQPRYYI